MIAAIALAACLSPPFFELTDNVCVPAQLELECVCTECMVLGDVPGVEWYEISRQDPDGFIRTVGDTRWKNRAELPGGVDPEFGPYPAVPAAVGHLWCFAWDDPMPVTGYRYEYRARACKLSSVPNCTPWSEPIVYRAAPYLVIQ